MTDKKKQPVPPTWQFTDVEVGQWQPWPAEYKEPDKSLLYWQVNGGPTTLVQGKAIHSIHCSDGFRWDCINGMTNCIGGRAVEKLNNDD